jgi:hypothetical protein
VRIERCGVCHSDLHVQTSRSSARHQRRLYTAVHVRSRDRLLGRSRPPDRTLQATPRPRPAAPLRVCQWIGCGVCPACLDGAECPLSEAQAALRVGRIVLMG